MRAHASRLGVRLPNVNPLDYEITFITYRLMAKKFRLAYPGDNQDSLLKLWHIGLTCLSIMRLRQKAKFAHLAWLTLISAAPLPICRFLVDIRANRRRYKLRLRALARPFARGAHSAQIFSDQDG
jgi:hypothetical protein